MPSRGREISQGHCHVQRFCVARVFGSERLSVSSSQNNRSCSRGWAACARLCPRPWGCRRGHRRLARRAFPPPTPTLGRSPRFSAACRIPLSLRPRWFLLQCRAPVPSFPRGRFSAAAAGSSAGSRPPAGSARPVGLRGALALHAVAGTEGTRGLVCGDDCVSGRGRVSWRFAEPGVRTAVTRGHACLLWVPF